jgi:hypothetical protein
VKRILYCLPLFGALLGCAGADRPDPGSPFWLPPVGSVVDLHQALTVPPPAARLFIQRGELSSSGGLDLYYPSCNFEMQKISEQPQVIEPGRFSVVRVWGQQGDFVQRGPGRQAGALLADKADNGSTMIIHQVHMRLASEQQPGVRNLSCRGGLDDPWLARPPSVQEMREALGEIADLVLPE